MKPHTRTDFDHDLGELARMISKMGGLVQHQLAQAFGALFCNNAELANQVIRRDDDVDAFERRIEESSVSVIAKRQPMAIDLRETVSALQISHNLERIGDLVTNIVKRDIMFGGHLPESLLMGIRRMAQAVLEQLAAALDCYARRDAEMAMQVRCDDGNIDNLNHSLSQETIHLMSESPEQIAPYTQLLFCLKNLERIGDHVTNIAESVYFIATGETPSEPRPRVDGALAHKYRA